MNTLNIRFCSGKGWDSKIIEWFERQSWSHVELCFHRGDRYVYNGNELTFGAQLKGGLRWRGFDDHCYRNVTEYEYWRIPINATQDALLCQLITHHEFKPYDWPAIASFALGQRRLHKTGALICSGWVAVVLSELGFLKPVKRYEYYDPGDVREIIPELSGSERYTP